MLEMRRKSTPMDQYVAQILLKNERGSSMIQIVSDNARLDRIIVDAPKNNRRNHTILSRRSFDSSATPSSSSWPLATSLSAAAKAISKWDNGSHCGMRADVLPVVPVASPPFRRTVTKSSSDSNGSSCGSNASCALSSHARQGEFVYPYDESIPCDESIPARQQKEQQHKNNRRRLLRAKCA